MTFDEFYNRKKRERELASSLNVNNSSILRRDNTSSSSDFDEAFNKWKEGQKSRITAEQTKKFASTSDTNTKTINSNTNNINNQNKTSEEELIQQEKRKAAEKSANAHNTAYNSLTDQEKKYYDSYMQKTSGGVNSNVGPKKSSIPVSEAEKKAFQKYQSIYLKNNNETVLKSKEQYQKYQEEHPELVKKQAEEAQKKAEEYKKNTPLVERIGNTLGDWQKTLTDNAGKATSNAAKGIINLAAWGIKKNPLVSSNQKVQKWIDENKEQLTDPLESFNARMDSEDSLASYDSQRQGKVSGWVNDKIMPTLGQLLPSFLMGTAGGKVASGVTQFAVSEGSYQDDAKARGMNEDETMIYSTIMSGFEGVSEGLTWGNAQKIGALTKEKVLLKSGKTAKEIVGEQAKKKAIKEANSSIIKRFGLNAFENAFQEGITEPAQELTAKGVSLGLTGKDKSNWENMLQRSGESAVVGGIIAVLLGGSSAGVSSATDVTGKMVDNAQNGKAINKGISDSQIISAYNDSAKVVDADKIINDSIARQNQKYNVALNEINNKLNLENNTNIEQNNSVMEKNISNNDLSFQFEKSENEKINNFRADMNKYMNNSEQAHKFANTVESVISNTNTNIRLNDQLESNINGKIYNDNDGNTIIELNPNSSRSGEFILMHELTHGIETKELKTLINDYAKTNDDFNSALTELKNTYKTDDVSDEVMCDISANLLGNEEFIQKIATEKPGTFKKIYNSIKNFFKKITGNYSQEDFIKNLEIKWDKAYQKNKDNISEKIGNNSFYSIQENENGKYVQMDTDQNIFNGVAEKDYPKIAKKYILEKYRDGNKNIALPTKEDITVTSKTANEYTHPKNKLSNQNMNYKMKASTELDANPVKEKITKQKSEKDSIVSNTWYDWLDTHFKSGKNVTNFKEIKQKIQEKVTEVKKTQKKIAPINDNMRTSIKSKIKENFDIDLSPEDISNISNKILANPTEEGVLKALDDYRDIQIEDDNGIDMNEVRNIKNTIRNTKLDVSSVKGSITDYNDMRKRNFGKLKLGNDGLQIDSFYQELSENYPEYFNKDITNVEDELNYLSDFVNTDFSNKIEYSLTDDDIKNTGIINDLLKYTKKDNIAKENDGTMKEIQDGFNREQDIPTRIEQIKDNSQLTIDDLLGDKKKENLIEKEDSNYNKEKVPTRQDTIKKNRQLAEGMIKNIKNWKDKSSGFKYQTETMERNMYDIVKDKDEAKKIIDTYFTPVHKNEAEKNRFINSYNEKIKELKLSNKEAEAVQFFGEEKYNPEFNPQEKDVKRIHSYIDKNQIDMNKVSSSIEFFRNTYDELFDKVNEVLKNNGYKEIPYRKGYFPHFQEYKASTMGGKLLTQLGINIDSRSLPTDIAGITENFVPGKTWNSSALERKGDTTEYNVLKGFDMYIRQASDNIFHTDDIQKLRGLENEIRYEYSDKSLRDKIDKIESDDTLDTNEKQEMINTVTYEHKERTANPMPNFVTHLREYTNLLANKKSQFDRNSESFFARKMYSTVDAIEKRFGANSVGLNISSALTNFIPITQASSEINTINMAKALTSTIKSEIRDDGFVNKSTFLTNRLRQSENLYKTSLEKISDKANILFDGIDSFTSNVIVRGKYYQNLSKGMSELDAINDADSFAANVMADRSKGATPTFFQHRNPIAKVFSQFQLEVNNQYRFMLKDLPRDMKKEGLLKLGMAFFKMFVGAYLYNQFSENLTGRKSAFSPIDIVKDAITTATNPDLKTYDKVSSISKDVAGELPFIGGLFGGGRLPVSGALPDVGTLAEAGIGLSTGEMDSNTALKKIGNELKKPVAYLLPPMGGGQIKKTIEGLSMYSDDKPIAGSYTDSGDLRFTADNSTWGKIKAGIFGQYSSKSANDYIDSGFKSIKAKHIDELKGLEMNSTEYREYQSNLKEAKKIKDDNGYQKYFDDKGNAYWYDEKSKIVYSSDYTKTSKSIKNLEKATQNLSAYEYINNLDVTKNKKNIMLNNAIKNKKSNNTDYSKFESYAEFDYSYKNPDKYKVVKNMYDFKEYSKYSKEIKDVKKEYKYSKTDERKSAIFNYIDGLDLDVGQKLFLYKDAGYSIKDYKKEMFDYIDNLNVSKNEKTRIWNYIYGGDL